MWHETETPAMIRGPDFPGSGAEVSHAHQEGTPRGRVLSRSRVSAVRASRPNLASSAVTASLAATRSSLRSSAATTPAPAAPVAGFKRCCMLSGEMDGADRDYFFPLGILVLSNYALERSVNGWRLGAAGAPEIIAPAAPGLCLARPAQRGR